MAACILKPPATPDDIKNLERSFRCHYFAYWFLSDDDTDINGSIFVEPYITGCARLRGFEEAAAAKCMPSAKERLMFHTGKQLVDRVRLSSIFKVRMKSASSDNIYDCGLSKSEFQKYIDFLCHENGAGSTGEPIHAVVLSSYGSFFRVVSDTNHLASLIGGDLNPEPADPRAKARSLRRIQKFSRSPEDGM